jgi:hypothetical protein
MRKGGGKAKGSAFERQIAKDIVKAFSKQGITQRDCWRSINSGGHVIACGDLEMSEKLMAMFPYSVECKFRKKIKWQNFMLAGHTEESDWFLQARAGALKIKGLDPLLVMKENFGPIYAMHLGYGSPMLLTKWKQFLTNAVKEANKKSANART